MAHGMVAPRSRRSRRSRLIGSPADVIMVVSDVGASIMFPQQERGESRGVGEQEPGVPLAAFRSADGDVSPVAPDADQDQFRADQRGRPEAVKPRAGLRKRGGGDPCSHRRCPW